VSQLLGVMATKEQKAEMASIVNEWAPSVEDLDATLPELSRNPSVQSAPPTEKSTK